MAAPLRAALGRFLRAAFAGAFCAAALGPTALARDYDIGSFDASIEVRPDSEVRVREEMVFRFRGSFQGVYRLIPLQYDTGFKPFKLAVKVDYVNDADGRPLKHELTREGRNLKVKVWVPGAQDAERKVVLGYRVLRALLLDFEDHDELYWNVTGNEWTVPILAASARVSLPEGAQAASIRTAAYTGARGSRASDALVEKAGSVAAFKTTSGLGSGSGLTLVVGWPKGLVRRPPPWRAALWWLADVGPYLIPPVAAFLLCFFWWRRYGRDPRLNRSVMPLYEPPEGLSASELGVLTDDSADLRDVSAGILDLAVRGHLKIEEQVQKGLLWDSREFVLTRLDGVKADLVADFDRKLIRALELDKHASRKLSDLDCRFYAHLSGLKESLYRDLVAKGVYLSSPDGVRTGWRAGAALLGFGGLFALPAGASWALAIALVSSAFIVFAFSFIMPAKTPLGAERLWQVLGFQEFITRAEKDRIERQPELFHKYLPYAMALGITSLWVAAFEGLAVPAPDWYASPDPFQPSLFARRLGAFDSRLGSAMTSAPRSEGGGSSAWSGGSGFSGGSSGGGFGGGGGGAF